VGEFLKGYVGEMVGWGGGLAVYSQDGDSSRPCSGVR
jgi:hypothetical protein